MGVLYLARRQGPKGFQRPVAIKVIHEHLAANKRFARMFIDEAKLSAQIDDPHVVRVEEFGRSEDGRYYLVMEYVHGVSLAQAIAVLKHADGIPIDAAVAIAMQICSGLHGAHEALGEDGQPMGLVHRDVSPHNVLVSFRGHVRIIDFGIAKAKAGDGRGGQTKTGSLRGKLAYMPPEQARSARTVDRRADLYAVALILWEMLAGRRLYDADNEIAMLNQLRNPVILPPSSVRAEVPEALDRVVLQALAQDPNDRPQTCAAFQRLLGEAFPEALRVMPQDIGTLMNQVRTLATARAEKRKETEDATDPGELYDEQVLRTMTIFGKSMHESVELADDARPSRVDLADAGEDNTKPMKRPARPDDGPPSVVVEEPQPLEDEIVKTKLMPGRPKGPAPGEIGVPLQQAKPTVVVPRRAPSMLPVWMMLGLGIAIGVLTLGMFMNLSGRSATPPIASPAPTPSPPPSPTEPPVLADPPPQPTVVVDPANADPRANHGLPRSRGDVPPADRTTGATLYDRASRAAKDGQSGTVRALLEARVRGGHGSLEEARLLKAACKAQGDTGCRDDINQKYPQLSPNMDPAGHL
jgi:serine/threonine-protein kinase